MRWPERLAVAAGVLFGRYGVVVSFDRPLHRRNDKWPDLLFVHTEDLDRAGANLIALIPWETQKAAGVSPLPIMQREDEIVFVLRGKK